MTEKITCAWCDSEAPQTVGRGRPRVYCSTACRRLAEYALARLQTRVRRAELERDTWRRYAEHGHDAGFGGCQRYAARRAEALEAEHQHLADELEAMVRRMSESVSA